MAQHVERNPVRAKSIPVRKAQNWIWSPVGDPPKETVVPAIDAGPVKRKKDWLPWVNQPLSESERDALQTCINRGQPFGKDKWKAKTAKVLGIESSLRPSGRPRKKKT